MSVVVWVWGCPPWLGGSVVKEVTVWKWGRGIHEFPSPKATAPLKLAPHSPAPHSIGRGWKPQLCGAILLHTTIYTLKVAPHSRDRAKVMYRRSKVSFYMMMSRLASPLLSRTHSCSQEYDHTQPAARSTRSSRICAELTSSVYRQGRTSWSNVSPLQGIILHDDEPSSLTPVVVEDSLMQRRIRSNCSAEYKE